MTTQNAIATPTPDARCLSRRPGQMHNWSRLLLVHWRGLCFELYDTNQKSGVRPRFLGDTDLHLKVWDGTRLLHSEGGYGSVAGLCVDSPDTLAGCLSLATGLAVETADGDLLERECEVQDFIDRVRATPGGEWPEDALVHEGE